MGIDLSSFSATHIVILVLVVIGYFVVVGFGKRRG